MIAISTYTEPQTVTASATESPQAYEVQETEDSEHEDFAAILAGMLQKPNADETTLAEQSNVELMELSDVKVIKTALTEEIGDKSELIGFAKETISLEEANLTDLEIPPELLSSLMNVEHLTENSNYPETEGDANLPDDFFNLTNINNLRDTEVEERPAFAQAVPTENATEATDETFSQSRGDAADTVKSETIAKDFNEPKQKYDHLESRSEETASLKGAEKQAENRVAAEDPREMRKNSRRDRVTFDVRDLRTSSSSAEAAANQSKNFSAVEASVGRVQNIPVQEITLELRLPNNHSHSMGQNSAQTTWEAKAGTALENMLARELHQNFNGDIVRHASMALRDGGNTTIKLALHPESLGNVKIQLEMSENKIIGNIVVESEEAMNAFRRELGSLEQAFRDSGFTNADLNLSLTADQSGTDGRENEFSFGTQTAALRYDESFDSPLVVDVFYGRKQSSVNLLA